MAAARPASAGCIRTGAKMVFGCAPYTSNKGTQGRFVNPYCRTLLASVAAVPGLARSI